MTKGVLASFGMTTRPLLIPQRHHRVDRRRPRRRQQRRDQSHTSDAKERQQECQWVRAATALRGLENNPDPL